MFQELSNSEGSDSDSDSKSSESKSDDHSGYLSDLDSGIKITKYNIEPVNIKPFSFQIDASLCKPVISPKRKLFHDISVLPEDNSKEKIVDPKNEPSMANKDHGIPLGEINLLEVG